MLHQAELEAAKGLIKQAIDEKCFVDVSINDILRPLRRKGSANLQIHVDGLPLQTICLQWDPALCEAPCSRRRLEIAGCVFAPPVRGVSENAMTGHELKARRKELELTMQDVADRVGLVHRQQVYEWERGKVRPGRKHLRRLAMVLQVSIADLLQPPSHPR
jgi:DNA-binding XRE family transcriptional regulator